MFVLDCPSYKPPCKVQVSHSPQGSGFCVAVSSHEGRQPRPRKGGRDKTEKVFDAQAEIASHE